MAAGNAGKAELSRDGIRTANARAREGFTEAYHALEFEYRVAAQLLKARARARRKARCTAAA